LGGIGYFGYYGLNARKHSVDDKQSPSNAAKNNTQSPLLLALLGCSTSAIAAIAGATYLSKSINYDPEIEIFHPQDATRKSCNLKDELRDQPICIHLHGWIKDKREVQQELEAQTLPNMHIASPNFPDFWGRLLKTSFGKEDALVVVHALNVINEKYHPSEFHLQGMSRGVGNTLELLSNKAHLPLLKKIGVSDAQRQDILQKIRKGSIVLNVPLCDTYVASDTTFPRLTGRFIRAFGWCFSRYQFKGLNMADHVSRTFPKGQRIFVYFEVGDKVVGNKNANKRFVEALIKTNPDAVVVEGSDGDAYLGGHVHHHYGGKTFSNALNKWRREQGIPTISPPINGNLP